MPPHSDAEENSLQPVPQTPVTPAPPEVLPPPPPLAAAPLPETPMPDALPEFPASGPSPAMPAPSRRPFMRTIVIGAGVIAAAAIAVAAFWLLTHKKMPAVVQPDAMSVAVVLPKDATVTAECVAARGKQYILPKDIPMGPIYDVYQGKVIAIEYLVGQAELAKQSSLFADLVLPKATYDHLTIMPMDAHAGENEAHFHAIAYLISAQEADKIKCSGSSSDSMDMSM